ncbi:hypothetical protein CRE_02661 [Caenorhabditis remanei]|uniref:G-protein coupled receptors family 1 profile domain-containing protein n=1 Tax=Caenorhabditis remanei TaxID=31234 RepID=E3NG29_CAERE|nr:hypothetical protein CRE_02661 [Caenorhabditis remanei]
MNLTTEQVEQFHTSIYLSPEFEHFSYNFDYVTVIVIISFVCLVPTVYATVKMVLFRQPHRSSIDIHPYVFKSFLCMQVSKVILSILDLIIIRIPQTTILTSYYRTLKNDSPLRFFTAACFSINNLSQLSTVLFCLIRLMVFKNNRERPDTYRCVFWIWSITSIIFCAVIYIIHFSYSVACMTLHSPFQYGAILVTSNLYESIICRCASQYTSYCMLIRPIFQDSRVNIVSCYFYCTHPYFKKKNTVTNSLNVTPRSNT